MKHLILINSIALFSFTPIVATVGNLLCNEVVEQHFGYWDEELIRQSNIFTVSATVYNAEAAQCDADYHITADGSIIDTLNPSKHRWIAVSRDLLDRWGGNLKFGDKVIIEGTGTNLDGVHTVRDVMNARFTEKIDFLVSKNREFNHWKNIKMTKIDEAQFASL